MCKKSLLFTLLMALFLPLAMVGQGTLTVHDGTNTNGYVPFYGYYADAYNKCEMVYPATELSTMADGTVTSMTFYASQGSLDWGCNFQVFVAEVEETTISDFAGPGTIVYEGALAIDGNQMVVNFATPYVYNGGNLLVGVYNTSTGSYLTSTWYGETVTGASVHGYSYSGLDAVTATQRNFLPKVTFGYVPAGGVFVAAPSNLNVTLTPGDGTVASLAWTENGTATQWEICLNDDETNLIPASTNPYQLTNLTPETAYTAKVRATTSDGNSAWSNTITFTPTDAYQVTVNDGTTTNGYVPIYGFYVDAITKSQFIIPARELADMAWGTITKMTFYAAADKDWGAAQFEVYMTETTETTLSELADYSTMEKVMNTASLSIVGNQMVVEFDTPYHYSNGNLLIGFLQTVTGTYSSCSWYGEAADSGSSWGGYGTSVNAQAFLPKTTFNYIPGEQPDCMWPTNLAVSDVEARQAVLSWTENGDATSWEVEVTGEYATTWTANTNPFTLVGLEPETDYSVKVRAICGEDNYSEWTNAVSFTTDVACPAPAALAVSDITAFAANVSWNAFSNVDLRYVDNPNYCFQGFVTDPGAMSDGSDASWLKGSQNTLGPRVSSGYFAADDFTVYTATTLTEIEVYGYQTGSTTESTFTGLYALILSGNPMEGEVDTIWGDLTTNIMTSTSFTNCYRGSNNQPTAMTRPIMAITATVSVDLEPGTYWLAYSLEGTGTSGPWGVPYAEPVIGNTGEGLQYTPSGWTTFADTGNNESYGIAMKLNLGDIESFNWTYVNDINASEYAMTNLDPETSYMVQVRANCGGDGYSDWVTAMFTTLPTCVAPTDLAVSEIEARQAVLAWTENGNATEWEVEVVGDFTTTWNATMNPYTLVGLEPETRYAVRVRALCGDTDFSEWSTEVEFTTDVACHAPTDLTVTDITTTSATIGWTSDNETFDVWYREHVGTGSIDFEDGTFGDWTTIDADNDGYNWTIGSSLLGAGNGHNGSNDCVLSQSYVNNYGALTPDNYLVSPKITLGGSITFYACAQDNGWAAEHFGVAVSTTGNTDAADFTTIQEWTLTAKGRGIPTVADNADKPRVRGGNREQGIWYEYTVDLSAYSGQGYVAIRHFDCTDNFYIDVDDIVIEQPGVVVPDWTEANEVANPYALTGLTPGTTYDVQVRSNCGGDDGVSTWLTGFFTTLSDCLAPWDVEVDTTTITATTATLAWNGYKDSYDVRYYQVTPLFSADFEDQLIPAEMVNDTAYPWIVVTDTIANSYYMKSSNSGEGSTTSAISMTVTYDADGILEFDAQFMGEGSGSYIYDECQFIYDGATLLTMGAGGEEWYTGLYMEVPAGEHTFTWSYSKDSSVNPDGDYFAVDNIKMYTTTLVATVEEVTSPYTLTGLTPETEYFAQVMGHGCTDWSELVDFTTLEQTMLTQTVELAAGSNYVSFYVETTLADLKAALLATGNTDITIKSKTQTTYYQGGRWRGSLTWDVAMMYIIQVGEACEITFEGMPLDPAEHPITIVNGSNYIGFPLYETMSLTNAFAGFAVNGDVIQSKTGTSNYTRGRWMGSSLTTLEPGQGYIYKSSQTGDRILVFPSSAK